MKPELVQPSECTCHRCRSYCERIPGWFKPGEAEQAAALLDLTLEEFFQRHLVADFWGHHSGQPDIPTTFVLRPVGVGQEPGTEAPPNPIGRCSFLTDNKLCGIHAAKPFECRVANHAHEHDPEVNGVHVETVRAWMAHQEQIAQLLGRAPAVPEPSLVDMLGLMFGGVAFGPWSDDDE